jgi:hypothetical protein
LKSFQRHIGDGFYFLSLLVFSCWQYSQRRPFCTGNKDDGAICVIDDYRRI